MKKFLTVMLAVFLIGFSVSAFSVSAEEANSVYLSDNGNDENTGLTAEAPVKTFAKAQDVLGSKGGIILIPDTYTYASDFGYSMPYVEGARYIIRGVTADSKFVHGRKNICMKNPITFDNLTYEISSSTWSALIANFNRLEFTGTVRMIPYQNVDERNNYLFVYGGSFDNAGKISQNAELILNGGTFGYIVGGCKNKEMAGSISISVGENAKIFNRIYAGGEGSPCDLEGTLTVNISGGVIGDVIFLGGSGDGNFITGDTNVTVTGGSFKAIYCRGSSGAVNEGKITIDVTAYQPAKEIGWGEKNILDRSAKTTVLGEVSSQPEENTTEYTTDTEPEPNTSYESESVPQIIEDTETEPNTPYESKQESKTTPLNSEKPSKGCKSQLPLGYTLMIVPIGLCFLLKKKKMTH